MGFFDIFKKKSTHEEKLYIAYDSLKKNSKTILHDIDNNEMKLGFD